MRFVRTWIALAVLGLAAVLPTGASAQCPLPDLLDCGPCWQQSHAPQLPQFPAFTLDATEICFRNCNIEQQFNYTISWGDIKPVVPFGAPLCNIFKSRVSLINPAGATVYAGQLLLWYSRTWQENDPAAPGSVLQVWRFLVNGNLKPTTSAGPKPCPTPPCTTAFGSFRVFGYYDSATNCATGKTYRSGAFTHECDKIDHIPGFPRGGVFHADRSYTFVWPGVGFTAMPAGLPVENGPCPVEDVRPLALERLNLVPPDSNVCVFEEKARADIAIKKEYCPCGGGPPFQYFAGDINGFGVCQTNFVGVPGPFPEPGYNTKTIGFWGLGNYPGGQLLRLNFGSYEYLDPCRPRNAVELFYGVCTLRHNNPFTIPCPGLPPQPLPPNFLDQGNSRKQKNPPLPGNPIANVKYASDIILNFNPTTP